MKRIPAILNIHSLLPLSRVNGPGDRMVIWLQGCNRKCPGCFNPETHSHTPHFLMTVDEVFDHIQPALPSIEGITISGGEPLEQIDPLIDLLQRVRFASGLSVVVFSGYELEKISKMKRGKQLLPLIDVLIAGPYIERWQHSHSLKGSSNQQIHFLTGRYRMKDLALMPESEVQIDPCGRITVSGMGAIALNGLSSE
jgi:anaerobic ribonucleoside-triphosphate reductase activating protein